jgi:lipoprotein-anchoring transpeptidase ErfK/SrfK
MRLVALSVLLIGNLLAHQVLAEDVVPQPLTRADCARADMAWDDNANVCGALSLAAEGVPQAEDAQPVETAAQPLTRAYCDLAGMVWDDNANACGTASLAETLPEAEGAQAVAETAAQPLTREDCDKAGMGWDDTANVCGTASLAVETLPEVQDAQAVALPAQPLTREDCDKAGMAWDDNANVCGAAPLAAEAVPEAQESQSASEEPTAVTSTVLISIDKASQKMTVLLDGVQQYEWPVSTGLRGYTTPSGTYAARSMNKIWYSKQWDNAPMPHAVFFTKDGHAIHGTLDAKHLGRPASHGCVRLSPKNAATLFALVEKTGLKNTQVILAGSTPGGEGKVANQTRAKSYRSRPRYENYYVDSFPQPRKRGGLFRRLFGG